MSLVKMSIMVDSDLRHEFEECVLKRYPDLEQGIIELMKGYVERQKGAPTQEQIIQHVCKVYLGDPGSYLKSREIEKIVLNKTDAEIEANRLA
ncbi:MAG: hypothetical protein LUC43_03510 [Burkholderiales bacterium]|nr:hypothetical protein [Burkholderiales bacterium]